MIQQLQKTDQPAAGTDSGQGTPSAGTPAPAVAANTASPGKEGKLEGMWTAQPSPDTVITVTFQDQGHFTWKVTRKGKDQQFGGTSTFENGILTLVQDQNSNAMVGNVDLAGRDTLHLQGGGRRAR